MGEATPRSNRGASQRILRRGGFRDIVPAGCAKTDGSKLRGTGDPPGPCGLGRVDEVGPERAENRRPCRREFKRGFLREFKRGHRLEGVFSKDFGPMVAGWAWGLRDHPELSEWVMNEGDGGSLGGSDVPALAQKVDLAVGVDPAFQVERQMEVQQGGWRTW